MFPGKYLKADDVIQPMTVTISHFGEAEYDDGNKPVVFFHETEQGLVLNKINAQNMAVIFGVSNTDHWPGKRVELYCDNNVFFQGKRGKGIRCRDPQAHPTQVELGGQPGPATGQYAPPQQQPAQYQGGAPQPPVPQATEYRQEPQVGSDDVPF